MRSDAVKKGPARAPARAMLKGTGLSSADLERPLVAVVSTFTDVMPCNIHLRDLAAQIKQGIRAAGGTPIEFNTIASGISCFSHSAIIVKSVGPRIVTLLQQDRNWAATSRT